jgi:hypothetical protein
MLLISLETAPTDNGSTASFVAALGPASCTWASSRTSDGTQPSKNKAANLYRERTFLKCVFLLFLHHSFFFKFAYYTQKCNADKAIQHSEYFTAYL